MKGELYESITTGKKSVEKRYTAQSSAKVLEAIATKGVNIVKAVGSFILTLATESRHNMSIRTVQKQLKTQIDQERDKSDTSGYNNIRELRQATITQRIQAIMALQKLTTDKDYWTMSPAQKKTKFQEYKEQVSQTEKAIGVYNNIFARGLKKLTSLIKDVGRAHDPFSEFNYPDKIRIDKHSNITAKIDKRSKKENLAMSVSSIRENLSHNTSHPAKQRPNKPAIQKSPVPKKKEIHIYKISYTIITLLIVLTILVRHNYLANA